MQERIIIAVGKDWDGFTFRLRPRAKQYLQGAGFKTKGLQSPKSGDNPKSEVRSPKSGKKPSENFAPLMSQVSISFDEKKRLEDLAGPIYKYVVEMLTGMTVERLNKLGGIVFADAVTDTIIHDTKKGEDTAHA